MSLRRAILISSVVLLAAACGARVSSSQVAATRGGAAIGDRSAPSDVGGATSTTAVALAGGAATATTSPGGAGSGGAAASTAPSDNGGATDVGITGSQISLGTVVTMSGPVPGLFAGAAIGMQAWAAYQNSLGGINGRKIKVDVRDDQFDTGQNKSQTDDAITKDFALVGSFSLYDDAGVADIERAGVSDIHVALANAATNSPNNFPISPVRRGTATGPWALLKSKFPDAVGTTAGMYSDVPASKDNYLNLKYAMESLGYKFVYERGYQPTETDFTADVIRMKAAGVKFFMANSDVKSTARIVRAMQAQDFKPQAVAIYGPAYDATFPSLAGSAAEGVLNVGGQAMYLGEDAPYVPEVKLFLTWLNKVKPGYTPDLFAAYGWGSGRLFARAAQDAGAKLTRAGLLAALKKIDDWNGYGLFAPAGPATKRPVTCYIIQVVHNSAFERWNSPPPGFNCDGHFLYRP